MTTNPDKLYADLLAVQALEKEMVLKSNYYDNLKYGWLQSIEFRLGQVNKEREGGKSAKALIAFFLKDAFANWSRRTDIYAEEFWERMQQLDIDAQRLDDYASIIAKGRFANGGQALELRYNWQSLLSSGYLHKRYTVAQLDAIQIIIDQDASKKLKILQSCLKLRNVASSKHLAYGQALGYFTNGKLLDDTKGTLLEQYFNEVEIEIFRRIWK